LNVRLNNKTAVIGCAIRAPKQPDALSLEELLFNVTQGALADAGIKIEDIDGVVVASNDQMDGRAIAIMAASGSVGGVGRDILATPSAAEHAFVMGTLRIASGQHSTQLIVSWSPTEVDSQAEVERLAADPYYHRRLPLDDLSSYALQASALGAKVPHVHEIAHAMTGGYARSGEPTFRRWPLTVGMTPPPVTGAVALVLASEDFIADRGSGAAWIKALDWATEPGFLGDRDLAKVPALSAAARRAYDDAGIASPREAVEVAEISDCTPYQQLLALEGLGLSRREDWSRDVRSGEIWIAGLSVNPSGGTRSLNAVYCNGLIRIAEAANQVLGRAGPHQAPGVTAALAHAASGFAMQYQTVVILGQER
jgi:acetyl-CoA C-acetyltransferase